MPMRRNLCTLDPNDNKIVCPWLRKFVNNFHRTASIASLVRDIIAVLGLVEISVEGRKCLGNQFFNQTGVQKCKEDHCKINQNPKKNSALV